jgi:hypothetical protein
MTMRYTKDDSWYQVVRITGPAHNLLGIEFDETGTQMPAVVEMSARGSQQHAHELLSDDVRREVIKGVSEANALFGTSYRVGRIRYLPTDSPPVEVYGFLAKSIVERLAQNQGFTVAKSSERSGKSREEL